MRFFNSDQHKRYNLWSFQIVCDALQYRLPYWTIYLYYLTRNCIDNFLGIPMGTKCASLVVDLFLFCYERDFMSLIKLMLLKHLTLPQYIYIDYLLNIDNPYFKQSVHVTLRRHHYKLLIMLMFGLFSPWMLASRNLGKQ